MPIDRRFIAHFDWVLLLVVLLISAVGILTIYSASATPYGPQPTLYLKQVYWIGVGLVFMLAAASISTNTLRRAGPFLYGAALVLLLMAMLLGKMGMGARRWVQIGPISFQPSEIAKVFLVIWLAGNLAGRPESSTYRIRDLLRPGLLAVVPVLLVLKQPDLGTAVIVSLVAGTVFFTAGVRLKSLLALGAAGGAALYFLWPVLWGSLKEYQRQRILVYLDPESDPLGTGYHIAQSKIAIGSGGFWGKGYMAGTQGHLAFLPERHTDFIFSIFAEEWGFAGSIVLLAFFAFLVIWGAEIAFRARERFDMFLAVGITALFGWYTVVNLGMTMGLTPVVGVPLPFMSYGGSSVVAAFTAVGLLMNVRIRQFRIFA